MQLPLLEHDQRTSFADEWEMFPLEENNYGITPDVSDDIYDGMDNAGIWGQDDTNTSNKGPGFVASALLAPFNIPAGTTYIQLGSVAVNLTAGLNYIIRGAVLVSPSDNIGGVRIRLNGTAVFAANTLQGLLTQQLDNTPSISPTTVNTLPSIAATADPFTYGNFFLDAIIACTTSGTLFFEISEYDAGGGGLGQVQVALLTANGQ